MASRFSRSHSPSRPLPSSTVAGYRLQIIRPRALMRAIASRWAPWQATPALTVALNVQPEYKLRLKSDYRAREVHTDTGTGNVVLDQTTEQSSGADFYYPTKATIGGAFRHLDNQTIALDVTWTHWGAYRVVQDGIASSPVSLAIPPGDFPDTYSVRLGYEHLMILPSVVLVGRVGAFYEGLPGASRTMTNADAASAHAVVDDYYGASLGLSLCQRSVIYDVAGQVRWGNDVGSGQYVPAASSADVFTVTARAAVTYQF
jgi:hypothetical protein